MALLGPRKRPMFDPYDPLGQFSNATPGIGDNQRDAMPYGMMGQQAAPQSERKGLFWNPAIGDRISAVGDDLASAAALWAGDTQGYSQLEDSRQTHLGKSLEAARKAQQQAMARAAAIRRGANQDDVTMQEGGLGALIQKPPTPHRWERNDGSLMEIGPDGSPTVRYKDPTPKMDFIPDGLGGGRWIPRPVLSEPEQLNVNGEWLTPPKLGLPQQGGPTLEDIQRERARRRQTRGF